MQDRYLYRAKRRDTGEWVEGYVFDDGFENGRMFVGGLVIEEYHGTACDDWNVTGINFYEVEASSICRYTGLKDKNGKLIWENDIASFAHSKITSESLAKELGFPDFEKEEYKRNYVIEFVNTYCTYGLRFRNKSIHFPCKASTIWMHDCIVIGNIFDNPELLE